MDEQMGTPTEEELRAAMEEQMRRIRVEDVVLQSVATLVNLAGRRLGLGGAEDERDLDQAKLAIDATRALVPMCPPDQQEAIRQALSQVQMAFAQAAQAGSAAGADESAGSSPQSPGGQDEDAQQASSPEDAERARARSKIWTPPGA